MSDENARKILGKITKNNIKEKYEVQAVITILKIPVEKIWGALKGLWER
jgi:hypothetical protein